MPVIYKKIITSLLIMSLAIFPIYSQASFFNKLIKDLKSFANPKTYNPITKYLKLNTITQVPYISDSFNFIKDMGQTAVNGSVSNSVNTLTNGIVSIANDVPIKSLGNKITQFSNDVYNLKIPQTLGSLTVIAAQSFGGMAYNIIDGFTQCMTTAVKTGTNGDELGAVAQSGQCFTQAVTMIQALIDSIKSIRKIIRYTKQMFNGKHNDDIFAFLGLLDTRSGLNAIQFARKLHIGFKKSNSNENDANKQAFFGQFSSIDEMRADTDFNTFNDISYNAAPETACSTVDLPLICTNSAADSLFERFNFQDPSLSSEEIATRKANFLALVQHAFGIKFYAASSTMAQDDMLNALNQALFQPDVLGDGIDRRIPYFLSSDKLDDGNAVFLSTENDGMIVLNQTSFNMPDLEQDDIDQLTYVYTEELGHYLNFMRCKMTNEPLVNCEVTGEAGARFADAVLLDSDNLTADIPNLNPQDSDLSTSLTLANDGGNLHYETFPSMVDLQTQMYKKDWKFRWRFRMQVGFKSKQVGADSTAILEIRYTPPRYMDDKTYYSNCQSEKCVSSVGFLQIRLADEVYVGAGNGDSNAEKNATLYGEIGLARGHSLIFPMIKNGTTTDTIAGKKITFNTYDTKKMKHKAKYTFDQTLYSFNYLNMFGDEVPKIIPYGVGAFNNILITGYAGPSASWSIQNTDDIYVGLGMSVIGASVGCGAGGLLGSYYGEQIDGCVAGSQVGEALALVNYAWLFSPVAKASIGGGAIFSNRIKVGGLFTDSITSFVQLFGYQPKTRWEAGGSFSVEIRNEFIHDKSVTGNNNVTKQLKNAFN
ncbi:hypothetical protein [uncultured Shewanella sp.]|uniref:hypothetical protein n=1 Tax=uncultured Shewanella sp. TaxID=173975 RepID=UPI00260E9D33|nr:hypothetical protein [uncultured Shewanella sp.]